MSLNRIPTYQEPLTKNSSTTRGWYTFWLGLLQGQPTGPVAGITPTGSPYSYVALSGGSVLVQGGTVSKIELSRDGVTFYTTGQTVGTFPMAQGDTLRVTYSVLPTLTFFPR